jgi:ubiquinone/menaquinone biosynthesis C-methylase UbiE
MSLSFKKGFIKLRRFMSRPGEKGEPSAGFFPPRIRTKASQLCRDKTGRVLEVGCGEGLFLRALAESVPDLKITGVDSRSDILNAARIRTSGQPSIELKEADARKLPFADNYFSAVFSLNMLYNLVSRQDVEQVLSEMGRVCERAGTIIFDVRNRRNILLYYGYKWVKYYDPTCPWPLETYRIEEIEEILKRLNFRILKIVPIGFPLKSIAPVLLIEAEKK